MNHVSENHLRKWLANVWKRGDADIGLQWIEPAAGSSIGFPDVLCPVWPSLLPVELKVAKRNAFDAFTCDVRPVQKRFHLMMERQNMFAAFLIATGDKESFDVWLCHAAFHPWENNATPGETLIAGNQTTNATVARVHLVHELLNLMNKHDQVMLQIPGQHEIK